MWKLSIQLVVGVGAIIVSSQLAIAAPKETNYPKVDQINGRKILGLE